MQPSSTFKILLLIFSFDSLLLLFFHLPQLHGLVLRVRQGLLLLLGLRVLASFGFLFDLASLFLASRVRVPPLIRLTVAPLLVIMLAKLLPLLLLMLLVSKATLLPEATVVSLWHVMLLWLLRSIAKSKVNGPMLLLLLFITAVVRLLSAIALETTISSPVVK